MRTQSLSVITDKLGNSRYPTSLDKLDILCGDLPEETSMTREGLAAAVIRSIYQDKDNLRSAVWKVAALRKSDRHWIMSVRMMASTTA